MGGKTSTSSQQVSVPPQVLAQYSSVNARANQTASNPFQQYSGQFVSPINSEQTSGINATNTAANEAQPYYGAATGTLTGTSNAGLGLAAASAGPVNAQQIGAQQIDQFENPYLDSVLGSTSALLNQNNQQQQAGQLGNAITSGAFGGDRTGIAAANLEQQQNLSNASTYSGIASNAFNTALGAAQQQQGVNLSAAQANRAALANAGQEIAGIGSNEATTLAGLGSGAQTAGLQGAQAQIGAGTLQQQTQQAQDTAQYNQFLQQQSYPFQVDQFLANIAEGTGALSGSTTTTTQPGGFFSDERLKKDMEVIGKTFDGQPIFRYKMGDDPRTQIGLGAQHVEKKHPDAVGLAGGYRWVDYGKATDKSANRGHFYEGGVVPFRAKKAVGGGEPYSPGTGPMGIPSQATETPGTSMMGKSTGLAAGGRAGYDNGGAPYDYGLSNLLAQQEAMYQHQSTGNNRNIPSQGSGHQLAVASGSPAPPPSGSSNVTQSIGLGKDVYGLGNKGFQSYQNAQLDKVSNYNPSASIDPESIDPNLPSMPVSQPTTGLTGASTPDVAPAAAADAAPAATADVAAPAAAEASGAAAGAAGDAAASAAPALASAATGAAADAGAEEAAALAAEYVAADAVVAAAAARRGGRMKRPGLDQGGSPYQSATAGTPYSADAGQIDIPSDPNTTQLKTAGPLKKQPTGLQTAMMMGNPDDASSIAGSLFSNQGLGSARGGRIGKDDGGAISQDPDAMQMLPEQTVTGVVPPPVTYDGPPPGLAAADTSAPPPTMPDVAPAPADNPAPKLDAKAGDKGETAWYKKPENVIPLLTAIGAMGTAPTKHLGVALAAGLGAGAQSYVPTQQGLAGAQATQLANQMAQTRLGVVQGALGSQGGNSQPPSPGIQASGTGTLNTASPASNAATTPGALSKQYADMFRVNPAYTTDEQAKLERANIVAGPTQLPGLAANAELEKKNRVDSQTWQNQMQAQQLHNQFMDIYRRSISSGDMNTAREAAENVNALHQWTGDEYVDSAGGREINKRTGEVPIGAAAQDLSPEASIRTALEARGQNLGALEIVKDENGMPHVINKAPSITGGGGSAPSTAGQVPSIQAGPRGATPASNKPSTPLLADPDSVPKIPAQSGFATKNSQIDTEAPHKAAVDEKQTATAALAETAKTDSLITAAQRELAKVDPRTVGASKDAYNGMLGYLKAVTGKAPDAQVDEQTLNKFLTQLGGQNVKAMLAGQRITNQEMMTFMTHGNASVEQPKETIANILNYFKANNDFDRSLNATKLEALNRGANPLTSEYASLGNARSSYISDHAGFALPPTTQPQQQDKSGFVAGKTYRDKNGNTAVYKGNGQWQ
jgi:hypothetical protein